MEYSGNEMANIETFTDFISQMSGNSIPFVLTDIVTSPLIYPSQFINVPPV